MDSEIIGGLVLRMFVDGKLVDEEHVQVPEQTDVVSDRHKRLADEAEEKGVPWCAEVFDPDGPEDCNYHRFGTDERMMVAPIEVENDNLADLTAFPLGRRLTREAGLL